MRRTYKFQNLWLLLQSLPQSLYILKVEDEGNWHHCHCVRYWCHCQRWLELNKVYIFQLFDSKMNGTFPDPTEDHYRHFPKVFHETTPGPFEVKIDVISCQLMCGKSMDINGNQKSKLDCEKVFFIHWSCICSTVYTVLWCSSANALLHEISASPTILFRTLTT